MKMELSKTQIESINVNCPSDQGVFSEPNGIPYGVKGLVVYMRWEKGGMRGGCYGGDTAERYTSTERKPRFAALDLVLKELKPDITFLQFRELDDLIQNNHDTDLEYYGNSTDYEIEYILLSDLIEALVRM
jgi:hypothetical protein